MYVQKSEQWFFKYGKSPSITALWGLHASEYPQIARTTSWPNIPLNHLASVSILGHPANHHISISIPQQVVQVRMRQSTWAASLDPLAAYEIWRTSRCPPRVQEDIWTKVACHDGSWRPRVYQACPASLQLEWSSPGKGHLSIKNVPTKQRQVGNLPGFRFKRPIKFTTTRFANLKKKKDGKRIESNRAFENEAHGSGHVGQLIWEIPAWWLIHAHLTELSKLAQNA